MSRPGLRSVWIVCPSDHPEDFQVWATMEGAYAAAAESITLETDEHRENDDVSDEDFVNDWNEGEGNEPKWWVSNCEIKGL